MGRSRPELQGCSIEGDGEIAKWLGNQLGGYCNLVSPEVMGVSNSVVEKKQWEVGRSYIYIYILKVDQTAFTDRLDTEYEGKRAVRMTPRLLV